MRPKIAKKLPMKHTKFQKKIPSNLLYVNSLESSIQFQYSLNESQRKMKVKLCMDAKNKMS